MYAFICSVKIIKNRIPKYFKMITLYHIFSTNVQFVDTRTQTYTLYIHIYCKHFTESYYDL